MASTEVERDTGNLKVDTKQAADLLLGLKKLPGLTSVTKGQQKDLLEDAKALYEFIKNLEPQKVKITVPA